MTLARTSSPAATTRFEGLGPAILLGVGLLILSYSRLIGDSQSSLLTGGAFTAMFAGPIWGTALARNLAWFAGAQLVLHMGFGVACWGLARVSFWLWPSAKTRVVHHVFLWFLATTTALLASNAAHLPRSSLGEPYAAVATQQIAGVALGALIAIAVCGAVLITLSAGLYRWLAGTRRARAPFGAVAGIAAIATTLAIVLPPRTTTSVPGKPNVILIGLDSLRTDILFPQASPERTPNLKQFLDGAVSFTDALTPLARTFPSMTTILTGRNPHATGAVINLLPRDLVHEGDTIPRVLARAGYATAYATDEVRFSNIDETYGFQQTVMPPIGASEFLIAFFADSPLSNHVMNTWLGALLFPHAHANRGASLTYDPDRFLHRVDSEVDFVQPLLLAVHLTLPHWPYTWIDAPIRKRDKPLRDTDPRPTWPQHYLDVVHRSDRQFGDLLNLLEKRGVLKNAIVVVYSDHGESFGYDSELLAPADTSAMTSLGERAKWGHGTSVLTPQQYRTVLAIRGYGESKFAADPGSQVRAPTGVYDIAPTIYDLLSLKTTERFDGRTLGGILRKEPDAAAAFAGRIRFTETEFTPSNLATPDGAVSASVLASVASFYKLDPVTDRLHIKRDIVTSLFQFRHYAAIGEHSVLAVFPGNAQSGLRYLTVGVDGGTPQRVFAKPDREKQPELHALWEALHAQFDPVLDVDAGASPAVAAIP